ncbi:Prothoracicotropic hormone, partial [Frankliniella fusca]
WPASLLVGLVALAALAGGAASARSSAARRLGLSWLDSTDPEDVPAAAAINIGGLDLASSYGGGAPAPRDAFDADLDADLVADAVADNTIFAQPERRAEQAPVSAAKRTIQDLCNNIAMQSRHGEVAGYLRTGLLACSCYDGFETVMLGDLHYPHRVPQVRCRVAPHCRMRYYEMPLLTKGKTVQVEAGMPLVPEILRAQWRFEIKKIAVACECVHPDLNGKK